MPTSSSSSTNTSQTSSSSSVEYSSSSSSVWCKYPNCYGAYCSHFSNWVIEGISERDGVASLYVILNNFGAEQQIEVYYDPTYFDLLCQGRGTSGTITLSEMNSSGVSGYVTWDGFSIPSATTLSLDCVDASSYSSLTSSSSLDSSSSSSQSGSSVSSSSSGCCQFPYQEGAATGEFSSWSFAGMNDGNSNNCSLYVGLDVIVGYQVVKVYKDAALYNLVALGQALVPMSPTPTAITISAVLGSGLSGSVTWSGNSVTYPSVIQLSCQEFSSSSPSSLSTSSSTSSSSLDSSSSSSKDSSSTSTSQTSSSTSSSVDSSSSSSSSSYGLTSTSSFSSSSKSSFSTSSTSSSSSIDSSSTSSESIGNVSSSSSSSIQIWNKSKPLILANSALNNGFVTNKLSQSIYTDELTYDIGKVYAYFFGPYGNVASGTITMNFGEANDDGSPSSVIATTSISASEIDISGWYSFEFNVSGATPTNKILCFSMEMTNMDENNYVLWGYNTYYGAYNKAHLWVDGGWKLHPFVSRSVKITGASELFDLEEFRIVSPPGVIANNIPSIGGNSASYDNTQLTDKVEIKNPDTIVSLVIDASGSMGWSDKFKNRTDFITEFYNRFNGGYGSNFMMDYIRFGSIVLDVENFRSSLGKVATINVDLSTPTRTTYTLALDGQYTVANGAKYSTVDGKEFTVLISSSYTDTLYVIGSSAPTITSGVLTKTSGDGDSPINYVSYSEAIYSDGVIAYGFKNLENGHTYVIGEVKVDNISFDGVSTVNNDLFYPSIESPTLSENNNGPFSANAINAKAYSATIIRKALSTSLLERTTINNDVSKNDSVFEVADSSILESGKRYDLVYGDVASVNHTLTSLDGNNITIAPNPYYDIPGIAKSHSIIQKTMFASAKIILGTTLMLLIKDSEVTRSVTFFLQTPQGLPIEWDITPFQDWIYSNLFWLGETAEFNFNGEDVEGDPLPDGTRLDLLVDKEFALKKEDITSKKLIKTAYVGSDTLYLDNVDDIKRDAVFNLVSADASAEVTISEIGEDANGKYVVVYKILSNTFPTGSSLIYKNLNSEEVNAMEASYDSKTEVPLSIADISPILAGRDLDTSYLKVYDGTQVPYGETYDALNVSKEYVKNSIKDIPTIDGIAALRFLPITEDLFKTIKQKQNEAEQILRMAPPSKIKSQLYKSETAVSPSQKEATKAVEALDYMIETPIYFENGVATSSMTSYATELKDKTFDGFNFPNENPPATLPSRTYKIYPQITIESETGAIIGKQIIEPIEVDFASPININYKDDGKKVYYWIWAAPDESEDEQWTKVFCPGVYASSGQSNQIVYQITNKFVLVKRSTVRIRIYSNKIVDLNQAAYSFQNGIFNIHTVNKKPTTVTEVDENGNVTTKEVKSELDSWRDSVAANTSPNNGDGSFGWYANPDQWTLATETTLNDYDAAISNGYVTIDMPPSNTPCLYMIEASMDIGNSGLEFVRSAFVFNANPIVPELVTPDSYTPVSGTEKFELSIEIKWMGGELGVIEDGTIVNFIQTQTNIEPSTSQTSSGIAAGILAGPVAPIICPIPPNKSAKDCENLEWMDVTVLHSSGYSITVPRNIVWKPIVKTASSTLFFVNSPSINKTIWADGEDATTITFDILSSTNKSVLLDVDGVPVTWVGDFGSSRLMGLEQPDGIPSRILASQNYTPTEITWSTRYATFDVLPINKNVGVEGLTIQDDFETSYYYIDKDGISRLNYGVVSTSIPTFDPEKGWKWSPPEIQAIEPLAIEVSIENLDGIFPRDGVTSVNVVASVTWKGEPITGKFTRFKGKPNETTTDYPMPQVTFKAGTCSRVNDNEGDPIDPRGPTTACLEIAEHPDANLSDYVVQTGLSRTDIHEDEDGNIHTHSCEVDESGNGTTTGTIVLKGTVADHTHVISNYIAETSEGHTHALRCVAITTLQATSNQKINVSVNGTVIYDPTNSDPWTGYNATNETPAPYQNRKAFNTVTANGYEPSKPKLVLEVVTGQNIKDNPPPSSTASNINSQQMQMLTPTFYTSETTDDSNGGFDIKVKAYFSSYVTEIVPGIPVTMPAENVPDGTRIVFSIDTYKPPTNKLTSNDGSNSGDTGDDFVVSYDKKRTYLFIKVNISTCVNGEYIESPLKIMVVSRLQWLPGYKSLVKEPTNDEIYKNDALTKINSMGASQMYDAIKLAAQRSLEYAFNNNLDSYKHIILVLSDGDENVSTTSIKQAINSVHFIDGIQKTPVIPNRLGKSSVIDHAILKKIAYDTDGFMSGMFNYDATLIEKATDEIILSDKFPLNSGTYSDIIEFTVVAKPNTMSLNYANVSGNQGITYRVRTSADKMQWTKWTDWYNWDREIDGTEVGQYIQYEVRFSGDESFSSPSLDNGLSIEYIKPQSALVYFAPVNLDIQDDEYVSAVHITHHGTIPSTSTVSYGINMNDSVEPSEYRNFYREWIKPDEYSIILTRANELLYTENYLTYLATNGAWTDGANVEIRRFNAQNPNGVIVDNKEYSLAPSDGRIDFYALQNVNDFMTITISYSNSFRIICKIENGGTDGANIDHIALMYSIMKRFSKDASGNIIRQPLVKTL